MEAGNGWLHQGMLSQLRHYVNVGRVDCDELPQPPIVPQRTGRLRAIAQWLNLGEVCVSASAVRLDEPCPRDGIGLD